MTVGCLGAGYFSQFHVDAWQRLSGADLIGLADHDAAKAGGFGPPGFGGLEALLAEGPDILDIVTPPSTHAAAIRAGLASGVQAIICQKPFCTSLDEARAVVAEAETAEVPLIVHENFRFQPWYRAIKAALEEGRLGDVHQMTFRLRTGDGQGPRAYLDRQPYFQTMPRLLMHETGVHLLDVFRYLMGVPESVYADLRRMNPVIVGEDAGHVIVGFAGGVRAVFDGNRHLDHVGPGRLTFGEALVEGTGGVITLDGQGEVLLRRFGAAQTECLLPAQSYAGFAGDCVYAFQAHVLAGLNGAGILETTARDYLRVLELEAACYASDAAGARVDV